MRCGCGQKFNQDDAASKFNSHFNGDYDYYYDLFRTPK